MTGVGLEPVVGIFVALEHPVVVHLYADHEGDELRMLLDLEHRPDLIDDIVTALDGFIAALRERRESA